MAGKTLPGIGEDESGEHDAVGDSSDSGLSDSGLRVAGARSTDRMPLTIPVEASFSGPTVIDEDKVAEGLKKLRSLDEPLGPMPMSTMPSSTIQPGTMAAMIEPPSTMPTLKEGMPVVGGPPPVVTPAVAAAELLRSRGTAHGHALSGPGNAGLVLPVSLDDRMKGTLLGHSLHLPDLPEPAEEKTRSAEVRSIAVPQPSPPPASTKPLDTVPEFSHGDARFFDSEPVVTDVDPERPRPNMMFRGVVFFAVVSVFGVAAFAWVNARKGDGEAQATATVPDPAPTPAPVTPEPPAVPAAVAPTPAPTAAVAPPEPAPAAVEPVAPPPAPAHASLPTKLKRELAVVDEVKTPRPASHVTMRPVRRPDSTRDVPPPAAKPTPTPTPTAKHGKTVDDPDGTLPLSD